MQLLCYDLLMKIWAIADLHLSFGVKNKSMDVFGPAWVMHHEKIATHWRSLISKQDLVLIAGDISWALSLENALPDLRFIDELPGIKVLIKGNHDLWWKTAGKLRKNLPPSLHIISHDAFSYNGVTVAGARLWENPAINYNDFIEFQKVEGINIRQKEYTPEEIAHDAEIYQKEIERLAQSISAMDKISSTRIVMVHYPPFGPSHEETEVTRLLSQEKIDYCLFGHLHNLKKNAPVECKIGFTKYICTSCDWLGFIPRQI